MHDTSPNLQPSIPSANALLPEPWQNMMREKPPIQNAPGQNMCMDQTPVTARATAKRLILMWWSPLLLLLLVSAQWLAQLAAFVAGVLFICVRRFSIIYSR